MSFKYEIDKTKLMRAKLRLLTSTSENVQSNVSVFSDKFGYLFDNNYVDVLDDGEIIDDLKDLDMSNPCKVKRIGRYKGKYLR